MLCTLSILICQLNLSKAEKNPNMSSLYVDIFHMYFRAGIVLFTANLCTLLKCILICKYFHFIRMYFAHTQKGTLNTEDAYHYYMYNA